MIISYIRWLKDHRRSATSRLFLQSLILLNYNIFTRRVKNGSIFFYLLDLILYTSHVVFVHLCRTISFLRSKSIHQQWLFIAYGYEYNSFPCPTFFFFCLFTIFQAEILRCVKLAVASLHPRVTSDLNWTFASIFFRFTTK